MLPFDFELLRKRRCHRTNKLNIERTVVNANARVQMIVIQYGPVAANMKSLGMAIPYV